VGELDELQSGDPRQIGPYWLEGRLGSGGMGRVYLGRSPGGRLVAIKVIRSELAEDTDFRARFAREASAARKVSGIFTAPVVDADLDGPVPWLATSYIAGPSLADAVAQRGPMPAASVLRLAAGLAEGLAAIHSAGVVHRDLKPSNVLLAEDGPRLIDFGISRSVEAASLTRTGTVVGSPGFMSPEQAEGREVGPASDIFSLGAVLTFAATGEGPFGEGSTVALLYRVVASEPNIHGLPDDIRPMIEHCLAKDPRQRPTAAQLLDRLISVQPVTHPPRESVTRKAPGPGPAGQVPAAAAGAMAWQANPPTERAAVPVTYGGAGPDGGPTVTAGDFQQVYGGRAAEADRHRAGWAAEPPRRRPSRPGWLIAVAAVVVLAAVGAVAFLVVKPKPGPVASGSTSPANPTSAATSPAANSSSATQLPGAAAMATIGSDLSQSATERNYVNSAISGVQGCSVSLQSGEATLQQAISTRQSIVQGLQTLSVSGLPNGAQLVSTLTTAMQASITDDKDFYNWMADEASSGSSCPYNSSQDPNYAAGTGSDNTAATQAKDAFLAVWNPMAPRYGQPTYSDSGF
jgi:Protein kinase domain